MKNLYDILGVAKDATPDQIREAFKKLARQHHPDMGGNEADFKDVQKAYEVLSDPQKKAQYDLTGDFSKKPDVLSQAKAMIGNIFMRVIESEVRGDLVAHVRVSINQNITSATADQKKLRKKIRKLTKYKGRVAKKNKTNGDSQDTNMYDSVLSSALNNLNHTDQTITEALKTFHKAVEILNDYTDLTPGVLYPDDDVANPNQPNMPRIEFTDVLN